MLDLRKTYGRKYRVKMDEGWIPSGDAEDQLWNYVIPARFGHIGVHGVNTLSVHVEGVRKMKKIDAMPGLTCHRRGDKEGTWKFHPDLLDAVAKEMQAKRRRQLTPEQRAALIEAGKQTIFQKERGSETETGPGFDENDENDILEVA
jgi:hypothetical protein